MYRGTDDPGDPLYSARPVTHHFDVERVIKGDIGEQVDVVSAAEAPSCGLPPMRVGTQYGLLLTREGEQWHSGLCMIIADGEGKWAPDPSQLAEIRNRPFPWGGVVGLGLVGALVLVVAIWRGRRGEKPRDAHP